LIIDKWLQRGDEYRAIVLAHERQLVWQFADEIQDVLAIRPDIEMGDNRGTGTSPITIASRASLYIKHREDGARLSRLYKYLQEFKWLVICDEAHRYARKLPSVGPIIEWFERDPDNRRLGLTATPERSDGTSLESLFPTIVSDYRLYAKGEACAVDDGWAVEYDQRFVKIDNVDFKDIKTIGGDYSEEDLERLLGDKEQLARLIDPTKEIVGDRSTLIFSPTVEMAKRVALQLNADYGCEVARSLDGSVPEATRKEAYRGHQRGDYQYLSVCGLCREGYNDCALGAVAIFRPTKSRALAEQMKGRGCRPLKGLVEGLSGPSERKAAIAASDKPTCVIVDLVGVTGIADCASTAQIFAHGLPDEVVDRANDLMVDGETDVREALDQAEKELEEERKEQERIAAQHRAAMEELDAQRRAMLEANVKYTTTKVVPGKGGFVLQDQYGRALATKKQQGFLRWKSIKFDPEKLTKAQAGRLIGLLKSGASAKRVQRQIPKVSETTHRKENSEGELPW